MFTFIVLFVSLALFGLSLFSLYLMLYTWEHPERLEASKGPRSFLPPQISFSVLLPARYEETVIYQTIKRIWAANYPPNLLEIVVICHADDTVTIAEAQRAIQEIGSPFVRVETFATPPISKPHGLNVGFRRTSNQVVTIFDAEDDIDSDIFNVVNTVMLEEGVGIVQAGVQLMNFRDHWFAIHNCLEYFFWYKSRLHFHAKVGMIPLGGNTVFMRRDLIDRVGGWDENCLTEDADIGLRLSVLGEPIRVVYDVQHVSREETPPNVASFIRQRSRWQQGYLQVLRKGSWLALPRISQKLLAVYTLSFPFVQAILTLLWLPTILMILWAKLPVLVVMVTFLPLYMLLFQFLVTIVGAFMFTKEYGFKIAPSMPISMAITFLPFQWLQALSAARVAYRELKQLRNWEKTTHLGAHRRPDMIAIDFDHLLSEICERLGVERGSIMVLNPATKIFSILANQGLPITVINSIRVNTAESVMKWIAGKKVPVILDRRTLPQELASWLTQLDLNSLIILPTKRRGAPVAVLGVSKTQARVGNDTLHWLQICMMSALESKRLNLDTGSHRSVDMKMV